MLIVKVVCDQMDKKLPCQQDTTAKSLALLFANKTKIEVKNKKVFLENTETKKVLGDNDIIANIPRAKEINFRFFTENLKSTEMTEEEIELAKSMELNKLNRSHHKLNESYSSNDFMLKMPTNFSFDPELDFELWESNTSSKEGIEEHQDHTSKYHSENIVTATSLFQDLDFGFGEYDAKQMVKFEFESVIDTTSVEIVHHFDPKTITHLDFEAGVLRMCSVCDQSIEMRDVISAFGKLYHKKCKNCFKCNKDFTVLNPKDGNDGQIYCEEHWYDTFAEKCHKCQIPIRETPVNGVGKKWHPACFTCTTCDEVLDPKAYCHLKGIPYCDQHYYDEQGLVCPICELPIKTEDFVDPKRGAKFHTEHFFCSYCRKKLASDQLYKQIEKKPNKIYCAPCCSRIFGI